jgi:hypothetical protein
MQPQNENKSSGRIQFQHTDLLKISVWPLYTSLNPNQFSCLDFWEVLNYGIIQGLGPVKGLHGILYYWLKTL